MSQKIVAIVQARMGSTRLPGKVLLPILDKAVLQHIVERLSSVKQIDQVLVATSTEKQDDAITNYCASNSIKIYRGSEADVLDRYYHAGTSAGAEIVIRVTGDCPLIDPEVVSSLIEYFQANNFDHCGVAAGAGVANDIRIKRFPDGLDAEIFSMRVLTQAWRESTDRLHREHVTPFIWQQSKRFRLGTMECGLGDYGKYRWTLDNQDDYTLIQWIYSSLAPRLGLVFGMEDVLDLLSRHPEKLIENQHLIGKEGYEQFWDK